MVDLTNVQNLIGVLQVLCSNDSRQVQKVDKTLKPFLKNVSCVLPLMQVLCGGSDDAVRQQAGLLLKKKIGKFASRFTPQEQAALKTQLLHRLLAENTSAVANTVIGIIAETTASLQWPELASFFKQLIDDPNENHRILASRLLSELSEVGLPFPTKLICEVLQAGCEDSSDVVAEAALEAITKCIPALEENDDLMALSPIFPPFLGLLNRCLENGEDELVVSCFESLQTSFVFEHPLINDHIEAITTFILKLLVDPNQEHDESVKEAASEALVSLIEKRAKQFVKKKLLKPTLSMLLSCIAQEKGCVLQDSFSRHALKVKEEGENDANEEDELSVNYTMQSCQLVFDRMAAAIPAKSFADIVFEMTREAIVSPDLEMRKAGCVVLGVIAQGLRHAIRERIDELLQLVVGALGDSGLHVREAAAYALGQFVEHASPEVNLYHHIIIPAAIKGLSDEGVVVQGHCCNFLWTFCEQLTPSTIKPYLASLVSQIGQLAQRKFFPVQSIAIRALGAVVVGAEKDFEPYADELMSFLRPLLVIYDREEIWSAALGCVSSIAIALKKELFKPSYYELGMRAAIEGVKSERPKLVEASLIHAANMAKLIKKDFESSLKDFIQYIFEIFEEKEFEIGKDGDAMDEEDEDDEFGREYNYRVKINEPLVDKKNAAIIAIGSFAQYTQSSFLPYLDRTINAFTGKNGVLYSLNGEIRSKAVSVFHHVLEVPCDVANVPTPNPKERLELPEDVKVLASLILKEFFRLLDHDNDKEVISEVFVSIGSLIQRLGVAALDLKVRGEFPGTEIPCSTIITPKILKYLDEQGNCQIASKRNDDEGDEEEDAGEDEEEDGADELMENLGDLIGILAKVLGDDFVSYFDKFHPKLLKFTQPSRSESVRAMAAGIYSEVFEGLGASSLKYADSVLPVLQSMLENHESLEIARQNAAYCLGALIEVTGQSLVPRYLQFLQWLHPVCVRHDSDEEEGEGVGGVDVDNALGAVAKMILVDSSAVPLAHVLPVMFAALPLREDFGETTVVFKAFFHLIEKNDPVILGMVKDLVPRLIESFEADSEVPDEARDLAGHMLSILAANSQYMHVVHDSLSSVSDEEHMRSLQAGLYAHGMFWTGKMEDDDDI